MSLHLWIAFALASFVMGVIPGPGVTSVVGYAISSGRRSAVAAVAGMSIGSVVAMSVSLTGVGTLLAASATAFNALKFMGAAYLIFLGLVAIIRSGGTRPDTRAISPISPRTAFYGNMLVGALNPKTIVFFVAFAPQFIDPSRSYIAQSAILVATFGGVVGCTDTTYALVSSSAGGLLRSPAGLKWSKRAGGGMLVAVGLFTAAARRA